MALYRSPDYQTSFESVGLFVQKEKFNVDFQDGSHGGHLGFPIRIILATLLSTSDLNISNEVSCLLAFWFRRKSSKFFFSTWRLGLPSWISDRNDFSYFNYIIH